MGADETVGVLVGVYVYDAFMFVFFFVLFVVVCCCFLFLLLFFFQYYKRSYVIKVL